MICLTLLAIKLALRPVELWDSVDSWVLGVSMIIRPLGQTSLIRMFTGRRGRNRGRRMYTFPLVGYVGNK